LPQLKIISIHLHNIEKPNWYKLFRIDNRGSQSVTEKISMLLDYDYINTTYTSFVFKRSEVYLIREGKALGIEAASFFYVSSSIPIFFIGMYREQ